MGQTLALGPIFSAGFLSGTVAAFAGFNTPLSVALAAVGALALAYVLTLYGRRFSGAGGVYEYLARGAHPSVGIVAAGCYLIGLLFLGAGGGFVGEGLFLNNLLSAQLHMSVGWWPWALAALVVTVAVNYVGVRVGLRTIVATAALSLVPFGVIIATGGAAGNTLAVFDPAQTSWGSVFHGVLFAVSLFIGFETVATLGDEARLPHRSIPLAMVCSIALAAAFYLLVTYAGAIGFGRSALARDAWFASGNPFGELGARYVGSSMRWIVQLTIVLDLLSVCMAFTLAASRVVATLARDGLLPGPLGYRSRRFGTPVGGLVTVVCWAVVVIVWAALSHYGASTGLPDVLQAVLILSATGSYLITFVYLMLAAGAFWLLRGARIRIGSWAQVPLLIVALAVPILSFDGSLRPFPSHPNDLAVYFAAVGIAVAIVWYAVLRARVPDAVARVAFNPEPGPDWPAPPGADVAS